MAELSRRDTPSPLILIANDQEWTARAVESILSANGYRVLRAYTARETLEIAASVDPDLVILDQQLPDFTGVDVCRRLRADIRFGASLPVIITTAGPSGRQQRLDAYEAGAWEFYGQPLDAEALLHKMRVYLAAYRHSRDLRDGALVDSETGLYSRIGLARRATELLGEARRSGRAVACVRWTMGEQFQPAQASEVAAVFKSQGRSADALGRIASRDFAVVAPDTGPEGAERMAERLRGILALAAGADTATVRASVLSVEDPTAHPGDGEALLDRLNHSMAA
jgi:PleD family two-component response regulator